ncbi:MAG: FkbM family methyltransferase [Hyphomicrobiaceae bacterium]
MFRQIFVEREYSCLDDIIDASFIIDCGANVGYSAAYLLSRYPKARVVAIEPESSNFEMLRRNVAHYGDRVRLLHAAVWSGSGRLVIEENTSPQGKEWAFSVREAHAGEIPDVDAVDLTTVWREAGSPTISILKMDIEGSESVVFDQLDKPWLAAVENIVVEPHGEKCRASLLAAIDGMGFALSTCGELTVCKRRISRTPMVVSGDRGGGQLAGIRAVKAALGGAGITPSGPLADLESLDDEYWRGYEEGYNSCQRGEQRRERQA